MEQIELLSVRATSLQELEYKVSTREDVTRESVSENLHRYLISGRFEAYYFTGEGHEAHPLAVFRGRVSREDGSVGFDQRAWSASSNMNAVSKLLTTLEAKGFEKL